jgi:hypothetical protein
MSRTYLQQTKKQDKNNITTTIRRQTVQQFGKSMLDPPARAGQHPLPESTSEFKLHITTAYVNT